ncbi:MAG: hypothetical protein MZW92_31335 [Comamonadaceae bacterium]|nr:hypothetical protein [Comamonadaceae bacterium]
MRGTSISLLRPGINHKQGEGVFELKAINARSTVPKPEKKDRRTIAKTGGLDEYNKFAATPSSKLASIKPDIDGTYYIGFDPAFGHTGMVVMNDKFEIVYESHLRNDGFLTTDLDLRGYERIWQFVASALVAFRPKAVFVEDMFIGVNSKTAASLFRVQFIVEYVTWLLQIQFHRVRPKAWQRFIMGAAQSRLKEGLAKNRARKILEGELNYAFKNEHTADAASILLTGLAGALKIDYRTELNLEHPDQLYVPPTQRGTGSRCAPEKKAITSLPKTRTGKSPSWSGGWRGD